MSNIPYALKFNFFVVLLLLIPFLARANNQPELLTAYSYHLKPPYIIHLESQTGLYFDFVDYINQKVSKFQFNLAYLPRKRLDAYLEKKQLKGMILGVNPSWFKDKLETKYFWTSKIFDDRDDVVSSVKTPVEYKGPESLYGMTIGGVLGYYYFGINEAVDSGRVKRHDSYSEKTLLEMIYHNRVSAGIISNATFNYLVAKHGWQGRFHLSTKPHDLYSRHVLIPHEYEDIQATINAITKEILNDPKWQKILDKYHIQY